jgi:hypothetical protein
LNKKKLIISTIYTINHRRELLNEQRCSPWEITLQQIIEIFSTIITNESNIFCNLNIKRSRWKDTLQQNADIFSTKISNEFNIVFLSKLTSGERGCGASSPLNTSSTARQGGMRAPEQR